MPLKDTVVLVTGASSGIGAATARRLAAEGAAVALVARRRDKLEELAAAIRADSGQALVLQADVTSAEGATAAVEAAVAGLGRLDTLVNNAGVMLLGPALGTPISEWEQMVDVNVRGVLNVTHAALPFLVRAAEDSPRRVADLVTISSTAGRVARPASSVYNLTKFGVTAFSEALRQELLAQRVRVSVVEPGTVDTELTTHLREEIREAAQRQTGSIQPLLPEDIADAVAWIVTRDRRVAVNEILVRASEQTWLSAGHRDGAVQRVPELPAGGDAELGEHLAQVPFDRARAEEELGADLGVGLPVPRPRRDLHLLRGEVPVGVRRALAHGLAGGEQLAAGALGEPVRPDRRQHSVRQVQLLPGIHPAVLAAEPLTVEQVRAGQIDARPRPAQMTDGRLVQALRGRPVAQQRERARPDAERPVGARGVGGLGQAAHGPGGAGRLPRPGRRLDQLGDRPAGHRRRPRVDDGVLGRRQCLVVLALAVVQHRGRPFGRGDPQSLVA
jgi:NADP-dependent 3-hydroxy acid dehydrogenase YdfG